MLRRLLGKKNEISSKNPALRLTAEKINVKKRNLSRFTFLKNKSTQTPPGM